MSANNSLRQAADTILKEKFAPGRPPGVSDIEAAVTAASAALAPVIPECGKPEVQRLVINTLQASWNVYVEDSRVIELQDNRHKEWLTQSMGLIDPKRETIKWRFWDRYINYLESEKGRPESVIRTLDKATTEVLKRLEDPKRMDPWDRRGMVVGSVQSGKTGNYTGLICKAVDAGYRLVIVLAGMHENLRRQTQVRLDEELRGRQTRDALEAENWIGVGRIDSTFTIRSVTTSAIDTANGDFNKDVAQRRGLLELGSDPTYMVVKKNGYILDNINKWLKSLPEYRSGKVRGIPLLVIDDECDQASVNTRDVDLDDPEQDMTPINKQVRKLLTQFDQSAYVGYTATPFANIFIPPDSRDINVQEDLFPRDFIVNIEPPSNYIGPAELFGLKGNPDAEVPSQPGLPLLCDVTDHAQSFPPGHRKEWVPPILPPTLKEAVRQFMLSCALRWQRGDTDAHNSMLIHVSRYTQVQEHVERLITDEYGSLKTRIEMNDGDPGNDRAPVFEEFRELWERTYVPTSRKLGYAEPHWRDVLPFLRDVGTRIQVTTVNGLAKQALAYDAQSTPINVIAIGGDKFSRGFTLEGLTISYYLRATNMYDTLMQMGRWFGYRDGYLDLCRIYTTPGLQTAYRFIAGAIEELRRDFRRMARENATPLDFGHKVRLHAGTSLLVTARAKSRAAVKMRVSLDGRLAQTLVFPIDKTRNKNNFTKTETFLKALLKRLGPPEEEKGLRKWAGVPGEDVAKFISEFDIHGGNSFEVAELLPKYLENRLDHGELTSWTVAFDTSPQSKGSTYSIAGLDLTGIVRDEGHKPEKGDAIRIKVLTTPRHEMADLASAQREAALLASIREFEEDKERGEGRRRKGESPPKVPYPDLIRKHRSPQNGLLLLYFVDAAASWKRDLEHPATGFGISFPSTDDEERGIEYLANKVYVWEATID